MLLGSDGAEGNKAFAIWLEFWFCNVFWPNIRLKCSRCFALLLDDLIENGLNYVNDPLVEKMEKNTCMCSDA